MHSFEGERAYVSASVVKALLLAAELERRETGGLPLDGTTRALLTRMITLSDNEAADEIYERVGDAGLYEVAGRTGMKGFSVAGYWANAQITAEDMARFMWRLDDVLDGPDREFGLGLLGSITETQRWGIPEGAGREWDVRFKGGWRTTEMGELVHQAAELRNEHSALGARRAHRRSAFPGLRGGDAARDRGAARRPAQRRALESIAGGAEPDPIFARSGFLPPLFTPA